MRKRKKTLTKTEIIDILKREKIYLTDKFFVSEIGLFGSYTRGEQNLRSDIDILIDFNKHPDIFQFMEIEEYLSKILGAKIDLVSKNSLKPIIGSFIKKEVIYI